MRRAIPAWAWRPTEAAPPAVRYRDSGLLDDQLPQSSPDSALAASSRSEVLSLSRNREGIRFAVERMNQPRGTFESQLDCWSQRLSGTHVTSGLFRRRRRCLGCPPLQ